MKAVIQGRYEKDVSEKRKRDGNGLSNKRIMKQIKILQKQLRNIETLVKNDFNDESADEQKEEMIVPKEEEGEIVFHLMQKGIDSPIEYHCPIGGTPFAKVLDNNGIKHIVKARENCGVGSLYKRIGVEYGKMSQKTRITSRTVFKLARRDDYDDYEKKSISVRQEK
jgi:hypothetical protein